MCKSVFRDNEEEETWMGLGLFRDGDEVNEWDMVTSFLMVMSLKKYEEREDFGINPMSI